MDIRFFTMIPVARNVSRKISNRLNRLLESDRIRKGLSEGTVTTVIDPVH
jgi:hypothetical protein